MCDYLLSWVVLYCFHHHSISSTRLSHVLVLKSFYWVLLICSAQVLSVCRKGRISVQMWDFLYQYMKILLKFTKTDDADYQRELGEMCVNLYLECLVMMANKYVKVDSVQEVLSEKHTFATEKSKQVVDLLGPNPPVESKAGQKDGEKQDDMVHRMVHDKQLYALTRILAMSMAHSNTDTDIIAFAFKELQDKDRKVLIDEMNKTGIFDGYAIHLYHAPKMLQNLMDQHKTPAELASQSAQNFNFGMDRGTVLSDEEIAALVKKMDRGTVLSDEENAALAWVNFGKKNAIECMRHGLSILAKAYSESRGLLTSFLQNVKYDVDTTTISLEASLQDGALSRNQNGVFSVDCYALSLCPPSKLHNGKIDIRIVWTVEKDALKGKKIPPSAVCSILHKW